MASVKLSEIRNVGDFAPTYRWRVQIKLPLAVKGNADNINLYCETSDLPKATIATYDVTIRGHKVQQYGPTDRSGKIALACVETVSSYISSLLSTWNTAIYAEDSGVSTNMAALRGTVLITRLDNSDHDIWKYTLKSAILSDYDPGKLDQDGKDALKPSLTISYDSFTEEKVG